MIFTGGVCGHACVHVCVCVCACVCVCVCVFLHAFDLFVIISTHMCFEEMKEMCVNIIYACMFPKSS